MSEANQVAEVDAEVIVDAPESVDTDAAQTSDNSGPTIEDRAREQGWKPKEEYEGDGSKWVSAETFVAKGELIDKIESLGKRLKDNDKTIAMLKEHHARVKETEFKNAVAFLKAKKKEAYENGDVDQILELDDKIAEVRDTQKRQAEVIDAEANTGYHPDFQSWVDENKWYEKDTELRVDADTIGAAYKRNNPSKSATEVLEHVSVKIKKMYPEKFMNQNRTRPSAVEGAGGRQAQSRDGFSLTDEEKKVMNTFIRQGIMSKEEYIEEIKKVRGPL